MRVLPRIMMGRAWMAHSISPAEEKNHPENPWSYEARINKLHFTSQGTTHTGLLFLPDDFDASKKYPTLVFSSTMPQINELLSSPYAKKMAERGYVFFTFDHIGIEDTKEAIRDAVHYLGTLDFVDKDVLSLHPNNILLTYEKYNL